MTTEIAVINRLGVALAADSAVTISGGAESKVFDTGDKLFELSETYPIGVMVNGNLDLLGVPWEVIIKDFRESVIPTPDRSIKGWLDCLLYYITTHKTFNDAAEKTFVTGMASEEFRAVKALVSELIFDPETPGNVDVPSLVQRVADERRKRHANKPRAESLTSLSSDGIRKKYARMLNHLIDRSFRPVSLGSPQKMALRRLVVEALLSGDVSDYTTGIIVAGYGEGDIFPSLAIAEVDGAVFGTLKYSLRDSFSIDRNQNPGRVISFAQTDVIDRILSGADPRFIRKSAKYIKDSVNSSGKPLIDVLKASGVDEDTATGIIADIAQTLSDEYREKFAKDAKEQLENEFNQMVSLMPKRDVIELAEALVSITAVERKASSEQATVGGPIDVAFITKHEGFVWVKRKHYFDGSLNPRYFWRKFKGQQPAGETQ